MNLSIFYRTAGILLPAWLLDRLLGDPACLPHPVVGYGKIIAWGERRLNHGQHRMLKGGIWALSLIGLSYGLTWVIEQWLFACATPLGYVFDIGCLFFCLAGTTLSKEVRLVFEALDRSLDEGRMQVARIVGRDTSALSAQEVRAAALETLAENLSDGVIAPLFWYMLLGIPGAMMYKMINTLDSMIGYHSERYLLFGRIAAKVDDVANFLPARLTALLMVLSAGRPSLLRFVRRYGRAHASPNSGYPEAALAGILNARFGGPHYYFGELFDKPFIGENERPFTTQDMQTGLRINLRSEWLMLIVTLLGQYLLS